MALKVVEAVVVVWPDVACEDVVSHDGLLPEGGFGFERERRAHATAWLAPLPPEPVEKELAVRVSPGLGNRVVRVMRSVLREPMTTMVGMDIMDPDAANAIECG